jgi:bifunctional oligoribonuclease and PAP phosphatase NrnA
VPRKFQFLPHSELLKRPPSHPQPFDVVIAVDSATYERLGNGIKQVASRKCLINLDHHISNPGYGDLNWIDAEAPASGQVVYHLLAKNCFPINADIAACLYAAILTDTGSFQFPNTTAESLRVAAALVEHRFDLGQLARHIYESYPLSRAKLLRAILDNLQIIHNDRLAYYWLTAEMYHKTGAVSEDTEGLIDHARAIDTVAVAVMFEETDEPGKFRLSFRSKHPKIDVNKIATKFGGGGHREAAGARLRGTKDEVERRVLTVIEEELKTAGL